MQLHERHQELEQYEKQIEKWENTLEFCDDCNTESINEMLNLLYKGYALLAMPIVQSDAKRTKPLFNEMYKSKLLKTMVISFAIEILIDDMEEKKLRTIDICKKIHSSEEFERKLDAYGIFEIFPAKPEQLKPLLKGILPKYAKKGGRPRK